MGELTSSRSLEVAQGRGRLSGRRVLVTRPRERASALCFLLEDEGAQVLVAPVLELAPPTDERPLRSAAEHLHRYRWVAFASPAAVEALVEAARRAGTLPHLASARLAAVGPATSRALTDRGLKVQVEAAVSTGEGLFEAMAGELTPTDEVLLPCAEEGRPQLGDALQGLGVRVARVSAYRSVEQPLPAEVLSELALHPLDAAVFASPRTALAFLEAAGEVGAAALAGAKLIAIGPTTAAALLGLGRPATAVAEAPTAEGLLEAVVRALEEGGSTP